VLKRIFCSAAQCRKQIDGQFSHWRGCSRLQWIHSIKVIFCFHFLQPHQALIQFPDDQCSEAIPIPIKSGLNELPPAALANRSTAQPRAPSPRFSVSTTRRSVPTAAEKTEYGTRFTSPTAEAPKLTQDRDNFSSHLEQERAHDNPPELENDTSPRESAGPAANWSNVMQQSVRMDRRAATELSNIAQPGSYQLPTPPHACGSRSSRGTALH
jgi:hypothetical protein